MFASRVGKLLHANRVTSITRHGDVALDAELLAHELAHVSQWRTFGSVGFATKYLLQFAREFLRLAFRGDFRNIMFHAYYNIPLEVEARDARPE